jgi:cell division protein FtsN
MLQIGAYESPELANGAFAAFKARFGGVAGALSEDVKKVDLGAKGVWYRLRVGPYATKAEAAALCQTLKAKGATCFLATP